jgi:hypothetical protein
VDNTQKETDELSSTGPIIDVMFEGQVYKPVSLGDLYADECSICGGRAPLGLASCNGPDGCVEAVKASRVFCRHHFRELMELTIRQRVEEEK